MNTSALLDLLSHTALKGAAVLLMALLLGLILQRMAAARRYALWITAISTLAILPLAMWVLPAWHVLPQKSTTLDWPMMELKPVNESDGLFLPPEDLNVTVPAARPARPTPAQIAARPSFSWNISWHDVVEYLPVAWMLIASLLLLRLGCSAWRLHRLEASLRPGECALLIQTGRELGLRRMPRLFIGPSDSVPMVWGVLKPRLLLPAGFDTWSSEKLRGVLLHELAHLKRSDPLALWMAQCVKALHWFNPLVWLTLRQLRADQERACDDAVLRQGVRASDYAQSLLDFSSHNRLAPGLSLCALTITRRAPVEARVKAILDPQRRREGLTLRWLAGLAGCALLITLPVAMLHAIEGPTLRGRILDRNGVVLAQSTKEKVRNYPLKTLAAHVVGYTGRTKRDDDTASGREALELQHDAALRQGQDVSLSLDMRVQALTTRAMTEGGLIRGAAIVLDPRSGEILAAVSLPAYDANHFVPSISAADYESYVRDKDLPLFNRCIRGLYPPASTFTPLTAMAGFSTGLRNEHYQCTGSVTYGTRVLHCSKGVSDDTGHGTLNLKEAVLGSCNCYWYQFGNATRVGAFEKLFDALGFNQSYDLVSHESIASLPSEAQLKKGSTSQGQVNMANLAIGHGLVLLSPVHFGILAATVANGGKVPQPSLVKRRVTAPWRVDLAGQGVTVDSIELLRQGMREAVNHAAGTGKSAKSDKVVIAAKTGTAPWKLSSDQKLGLMIGFAPYDQPQIAFAVIYEGRPGEAVSGGALCGPIVKRIVEEALALPADGSGEVMPVEEKSVVGQIQFDLKGADFSRQVIRLGEEYGVVVKESLIHDGKLQLIGKGPSAMQVLNYLSKLQELDKEHQLEWKMPPPVVLGDLTVHFKASSVLRPKTSNASQPLEKTAASSKPSNQAKPRQQNNAAIRMQPALANRWAIVKNAGLLADLPAEAVVPSDFLEREAEQIPFLDQFHFSVPREAAQRWLIDSVFAKKPRGISLNWPDPPQPFQLIYTAAKGCWISVQCVDGKTVQVIVTKPKTPILIAPDESQEPRPAGKLAPEYRGKGLTQSDGTPTLDVAAQTLRPAISLQEVRLPTFRPQVSELRWQAPEPPSCLKTQMPDPLNRLQGELSEESEKALRRSLGAGSRMQQALWVKAPQH